ncbi:MAG: hypothetical protein JF591_17285 [Lysobacter sp.]|nr:hypothetical protein [Lysobacter sp.]
MTPQPGPNRLADQHRHPADTPHRQDHRYPPTGRRQHFVPTSDTAYSAGKPQVSRSPADRYAPLLASRRDAPSSGFAEANVRNDEPPKRPWHRRRLDSDARFNIITDEAGPAGTVQTSMPASSRRDRHHGIKKARRSPGLFQSRSVATINADCRPSP